MTSAVQYALKNLKITKSKYKIYRYLYLKCVFRQYQVSHGEFIQQLNLQLPKREVSLYHGYPLHMKHLDHHGNNVSRGLTHFCPPLRFRNQVPTFSVLGTVGMNGLMWGPIALHHYAETWASQMAEERISSLARYFVHINYYSLIYKYTITYETLHILLTVSY